MKNEKVTPKYLRILHCMALRLVPDEKLCARKCVLVEELIKL
jgi:hypothetical protein